MLDANEPPRGVLVRESHGLPGKIRPSNFQINRRATNQDLIAGRWLRVGNWDLALKPIWKLGNRTIAGLRVPLAGVETEDEAEHSSSPNRAISPSRVARTASSPWR